jgi:two-component system, chemotaxis family, protein-glutamate methylesterase/glutaminase
VQPANHAILPQSDVALPPVVVIAASADGIAATSTIIKDLPADFPAAVVVLQHRPADGKSMLTELYALRTRMAVTDALSGHRLRAGVVYLAKPDRHLTFNRDGTFSYVDGTRIRHLMSSANPLFTSAAEVFGAKAIAVVLTGSGFDGTDGVQAIRALGGTVIAQDPTTSRYPSMPAAAIRTGSVDYVLPIEDVAPLLIRLTRTPPVANSQLDAR